MNRNLRSSTRIVTFTLILAATGVGCADDLFVPPAQAGAGLSVSYVLAPGAATDPAAAFSKADRAHVRVTGPGLSIDTVVVFAPAADTARLTLTVGGAQSSASYNVQVELRRGVDPLFRGSVSTPIAAGETTEAVVPVQPVAAQVVLPDSLAPLSAIGASFTLNAVVLFATGDEIPDAEVVWSSSDSLVASVTATGRVEARAPGVVRIQATYEDQTTSRTLRVRVPPEREHAVAVGSRHSCVLDENGEAFCWGHNSVGQLGDGSINARSTPGKVTGGLFFTRIAAGSFTTCGLSWDRAVYCWGNSPGTGSQTSPFRVSGATQFTAISVGGSNYACGLSVDGNAQCIGGNMSGQLGTGDTIASSNFRAVAGNVQFRSVSAGLSHTCGVAVDGQGFCWGWNQFSQTGTGLAPSLNVLTPTPVTGGLSFSSIDAGATVSCATEDFGTYCWGSNFHGSLGNGETTSPAAVSPSLVVGGGAYDQIATANANNIFSPVCGTTANGGTECWGANRTGQLGTTATLDECTRNNFGTFGCTGTPVPVAGGLSFAVVEPSGDHTCGLTRDQRLFCWGNNESGQLGDGTTITAMTPVQIGGAIRLP